MHVVIVQGHGLISVVFWGRGGVGGRRRSGLPGAGFPSPQVPPWSHLSARSWLIAIRAEHTCGGRVGVRRGAAAVRSPRGRLPFSRGAPLVTSERALSAYRYTCRTYMWREGWGEKGGRGAAAARCPRSLLPFSRGAPLSHLRRGVGGPRRPGIPGAGCPSPQVPPSHIRAHIHGTRHPPHFPAQR